MYILFDNVWDLLLFYWFCVSSVNSCCSIPNVNRKYLPRNNYCVIKAGFSKELFYYYPFVWIFGTENKLSLRIGTLMCHRPLVWESFYYQLGVVVISYSMMKCLSFDYYLIFYVIFLFLCKNVVWYSEQLLVFKFVLCR